MQVVINGQPVFDLHSAREWVKSFEPPEETIEIQEEEQPPLSDGADANESGEKETKKEKKTKSSRTDALGRSIGQNRIHRIIDFTSG